MRASTDMKVTGDGGVVERHITEGEVALYVDAEHGRSAEIQTHLAVCVECRTEVADVGRLVRTLPDVRRSWVRRRVWLPVAAAAAAAVVLLFRPTPSPVEHREGAVTTIMAPVPLTPAGFAASTAALVWSSVPLAHAYHARVFDEHGTVLWQRETTDTIVAIPASVALRPGARYYWNVEARTGFDRGVTSELTEFTVRRARRSR
jgi:hypothetical protein